MNLEEYLSQIEDLDQSAMDSALNHWDHLTHPIGSLGELEQLSIRLAGIQQKTIPSIDKKTIIVMCSDNGIFEEDISSSPQDFTQMLANTMVDGGTGVCALANYANSNVDVVNIGMIETLELDSRVINRPVRVSTNNFYKEPAMSRDEALKAIETGIEIAEKRISEGYNLLGTGELGIANTTTSSAVLYGITDLKAEECVGLGAGITDAQLEKKLKVVKESVDRYNLDKDDVIGVLSHVGGLDIAGLVGVFLAAAKNRVGVVVDGIISSVAALCAVKLNPKVKGYLFASHLSRELSSAKVLELLDLKPVVDLNMRLGEGSGCPFTFLVLESAITCMNEMKIFTGSDLNPEVQVNIRDKVKD